MHIFKKNYLKYLCFIISFAALSCGGNSNSNKQDETLLSATWEDILKKADGTTVTFMYWQGSPKLNEYISNFLKPNLKEKFNINLEYTNGQGPEIVQLLMSEQEAGVDVGQVDIVWINGPTTFQIRQINGLWGPFVKQLPNTEYINFKDPTISEDSQQPVDYMECPWSLSQFAFVHDSAVVPNPPKNLKELESYLQQNPGTFTISNDFTGMAVLKSFLAEISGSPTGLDGAFNEARYDSLSNIMWDYINRNKQYFWKEGKTFPKEHTVLEQMMASGELKIGYSFSEGKVVPNIMQGLYPKTMRAYAWDNGTVRGASYQGIPYNAPNKAGAMAVINYMISPEAQYKLSDLNGNGGNPALDLKRLDDEWQQKFNELNKLKFAANLEDLRKKAINQPTPEYMLHLYEDFRSKVIEAN